LSRKSQCFRHWSTRFRIEVAWWAIMRHAAWGI